MIAGTTPHMLSVVCPRWSHTKLGRRQPVSPFYVRPAYSVSGLDSAVDTPFFRRVDTGVKSKYFDIVVWKLRLHDM